MKKALLASSALVAAAVIANPALAANEPIKLGIGGYGKAALGVVNQDDAAGEPGDDVHEVAIKKDLEVHFKGSTTLDNGLTIGARVELEGYGQSSDQVDEAFFTFSGGFGRIVIGEFDGAQREMGHIAPGGTPNFDVNTPFFNFSSVSGGITTITGTSGGDQDKIFYFSPMISGFQFGVSWAPDDSEYFNAANATPSSSTAGGKNNIVQAAVTFKNDYLSAALTGGTAEQEAPTAGGLNIGDIYSVSGGVTLSMNGFAVGTSAQWNNENQANGTGLSKDVEDIVFDVGVSYGMGPWKVGAKYAHGDYDADIGSTSDVETNAFMVGGSYTLGPGVILDAAVVHQQRDTSGGADNDGTFVAVGSTLAF
jgi:predicted porin